MIYFLRSVPSTPETPTKFSPAGFLSRIFKCVRATPLLDYFWLLLPSLFHFFFFFGLDQRSGFLAKENRIYFFLLLLICLRDSICGVACSDLTWHDLALVFPKHVSDHLANIFCGAVNLIIRDFIYILYSILSLCSLRCILRYFCVFQTVHRWEFVAFLFLFPSLGAETSAARKHSLSWYRVPERRLLKLEKEVNKFRVLFCAGRSYRRSGTRRARRRGRRTRRGSARRGARPRAWLWTTLRPRSRRSSSRTTAALPLLRRFFELSWFSSLIGQPEMTKLNSRMNGVDENKNWHQICQNAAKLVPI